MQWYRIQTEWAAVLQNYLGPRAVVRQQDDQEPEVHSGSKGIQKHYFLYEKTEMILLLARDWIETS